jgi:hypothetical protein
VLEVFIDGDYAGRSKISCVSDLLGICGADDDQLRNLVWATSKHDVYLMHSYSVMHWSPLTRKGTEVLNVAGPVVPALEVITSATWRFLWSFISPSVEPFGAVFK